MASNRNTFCRYCHRIAFSCLNKKKKKTQSAIVELTLTSVPIRKNHQIRNNIDTHSYTALLPRKINKFANARIPPNQLEDIANNNLLTKTQTVNLLHYLYIYILASMKKKKKLFTPLVLIQQPMAVHLESVCISTHATWLHTHIVCVNAWPGPGLSLSLPLSFSIHTILSFDSKNTYTPSSNKWFEKVKHKSIYFSANSNQRKWWL